MRTTVGRMLCRGSEGAWRWRDSRPTAAQLLDTPGGVLSRRHLRDLGWERRAVDAIFRELDVVFVPGYARGAVRVKDYLALLDRCTYGPDRVRPT